MNVRIRPAEADDAADIAAIYAPIVRDTPISFEALPPGAEEMWRRVEALGGATPWLVCRIDDQLAGYAYATRHRERAAYRWAVEVSVYVHAAARGKGVGAALYGALLEILRAQGFQRVYAGITLPNPASVALHESVGFAPVGVYQGVGFKDGRWHDVGWWQRPLGEPSLSPDEPKRFDDVAAGPEVVAALTLAAARVRDRR